MSDTIDSGEAAFSLRDYFAGQALAGIAANPNGIFINGEIRHDAASYARVAHEVADAMLAERKKGGSE